MKLELRKIVNQIMDKDLKKKIIDLIVDSKVEIGGIEYKGLPLTYSPAGIYRHHSYPCGLIQHIISSAYIALTLCKIIEENYNGKVDRDVVLASIIAHDTMKPLLYERKNGTFRKAPLGEKIDHLTLIVSELIRRGFPIQVIHAVAAHHGRNSQIRPHTIEALVCYISDYADSTLNGETLQAARFLIKDCTGEALENLTAKQAFAIVYAKQIKGCQGVREELIKIKKRS